MPKTVSSTSKFLKNVLWSWSGVAVNLFAGFFLSPFLIRRLGVDNFGVWTLVLAMVENYWLLDFGFRNATLKYTAHYRALDQPNEVNAVINTALLYSSVVSVITLTITFFARSHANLLFHSDKPIFGTLILIMGVSWSFGIMLNVFNIALEGFQRYDITSRLWIISSAARSLSMLILVWTGHGLRDMALVLLFSQLFIYVFSFFSLRRIFPGLNVSYKLANKKILKEMAAFASHNVAISLSMRILVQSPALLIGWKLPPRFVAYFSVPQKLLDYPADAVGRVGTVSGSTAADLYPRGEWKKIERLATWTNRYCSTIYFFLVVYLVVYGKRFLSVWLTPEFAEQSYRLLPILLASAAVNSSQYNSATILVHIGGQKWYARLLMLEAALFLMFVPLALSRYGLVGAASVMAVLAILGRGVGVSWMLTRRLNVSYPAFMAKLYLAPIGISVVVALLLFLMKGQWLPGNNFTQLGTAAALGGSAYSALAFVFVLSPEHRSAAMERARAFFHPPRDVAAVP